MKKHKGHAWDSNPGPQEMKDTGHIISRKDQTNHEKA